MKFTAWQIDKLIRGLHAYRVMKAVNGRRPFWKTVVDDLLLSPDTVHQYPEDGSEPPFKEEALRRFCAGTSTPDPLKLEDVRRFLIAKKVLTADEFEEDDSNLKEGLAVQSYLGSDSKTGSQLFDVLGSGSFATWQTVVGQDEIELRFVRHASGMLIGVEEIERMPVAHPLLHSSEAKDAHSAIVIRRGYAFTSSEHETLHVFVRGASRDDLIHYVAVPLASDDDGSPLRISFVRFGAKKAASLPRGARADPLLSALGVVRFDPVSTSVTGAPMTADRAAAQRAYEKILAMKRRIAFRPPLGMVVLSGQLLIAQVKRASSAGVAALLKQKIAVNDQDAAGMTALHHASARGARPCSRLLVDSGRCDYLIRDKQGRYAFELAIEWARDYALAHLLAKKQARQAHEQSVPAYVPRT